MLPAGRTMLPVDALPLEAEPPTLLLPLGGAAPLRLRLVNVGLACCAVEAILATLRADGAVPLAEPDGPVDVMIVSGTVTDKLAPLVTALHARLAPARVVSFGACANSGGPYWDSYCVTPGVDRLFTVDVWVPGCPPRPAALLDALRALVAS